MHYPEERIRFILADAGIRLLLTQSDSHAYVQHLFDPLINVDEAAPVIGQQPLSRPPIAVTPSELAYMMYTSGTTGTPKGVLISPSSRCASYLPALLPVLAALGYRSISIKYFF
ncbi:putative non-ribosomal peptide synthase [Paenibacillus sp. 598K]|uniref:AMP-binding protein n=1 Tax=Paenibacillus sp. 598K TaxID=1117987 RepID=UPI000FFA2158|nr:AMP-binding protein [Paenibacillus sp. 598K]GBF75727.1 putative non-ribosomal peptide synthase [Paenibacillus sp. 598K]